MFCLLFFAVNVFEVSSIYILPSTPSPVPIESWTSWSACSQLCGGGIAERHRICRNNSDTEVKENHDCQETVQYKLCNDEKCPAGKEGVGWDQLCERYNNVYYNWRPYKPRVEVINPCALRCYAVENTELIVQLPDMQDGRLCSNSAVDITKGVCHKGECVKVGCDHILNSGKEVDVCGICGGDSRACQAIEGEFQTNNLKVGYNDVVQIPAGAKNIQIIEKRGKNYLALRNDVGDYFLNGNWLIERPGQIEIAGTLVNYRRPQLWVMGQLQGEWETITAPGPTNSSICVMVLCTDTLTHIAYKFTLPAVNENDTLYFDSHISREDTINHTKHSSPTIFQPDTTTQATTTGPNSLNLTKFRTSNQRDKDTFITTLLKTPSLNEENTRSTDDRLYGSNLAHDSKNKDRHTSEFLPHGDVQYHSVVTATEPTAAGLVIDIESESIIESKDENNKTISKTNHNFPHKQKSQVDLHDSVPDESVDVSVDRTENIGTTVDTDARNSGATEVSEIDTGTPNESSTDLFILGYVVFPPQESASEMQSEWVVRAFPDVVEDVAEEETIVEDFEGPVHIHENNSTEVMNMNPNGERNSWTKDHDPYYINNGGIQVTYTWTTFESSECSATCTRGVTTTSPFCQRQDGERVSDHYCDLSMKPSIGFNECHAHKCEARWEVGKWSVCSRTCDEGRITRFVSCWRMIKPGLDSSVDIQQCAHTPKPNASQPCEIIPCNPTWRTSEWKTCNVSCGDGFETREVKCVGPDHMPCDKNTRPTTLKACSVGACKYRWVTSEWTPCPGICGVQTRNLECRSINGTRVALEFCRELGELYGTQLCGAKTCSRRWIPQQWSTCSVKCGQGTRTRRVICASIEFSKMRVYPDDSGFCQGRKPATTSLCITSDCVDQSIGQWFTSEWSQCSVTCGNGHREREVKCYYKGVEVNGCTDISRPVSRMVCRNSICLITAAMQANEVCKDLPGQSCRLIRDHKLCRLTVYNKKCCATCAAP